MENQKIAYKVLNQKHQNFSLLAHQLTNSTTEPLFIYSLFVLSFDDEIGQIVESSWPNNLFDKVTLKNLTGLGFPETNSLANEGELYYLFKLRKSN